MNSKLLSPRQVSIKKYVRILRGTCVYHVIKAFPKLSCEIKIVLLSIKNLSLFYRFDVQYLLAGLF
jgi:hypothetical protein